MSLSPGGGAVIRAEAEGTGLFAGRRVLLGSTLALVAIALCAAAGWLETDSRPFRLSELSWLNTAFSATALMVCGVLMRGETNGLVRAHGAVTATISVALLLHWGRVWAAGLPLPAGVASVSLLVGWVLVLSRIVVVASHRGLRSALSGGRAGGAALASPPVIAQASIAESLAESET